MDEKTLTSNTSSFRSTDDGETKTVLVVGYPKSGNTWLARLVAQLLCCPVKGFYQEPEGQEIAIEGLDRVSSIAVYKGHQTAQDLRGLVDENQIIYIVRDPRDVAVSGANYYHFSQIIWLSHLLLKIPKIRVFYYRWLSNTQRKLARMIDSMISGNQRERWLEVTWDKHVEGYLCSKSLVISYEDLLENPYEQCVKILQYLGVERSSEYIKSSIQIQSFESVKKKFEQQKDARKSQFLVKGKSGNWKDYLTPEQDLLLQKHFGEIMKKLGYI
jgi:hypothetical protein